MMIRKISLTLLAAIAITTATQAQSVEEIKNDRQTYIFGEGKGTTIRQADNIALQSVISQISVNVDSNTTMSDVEYGVNDELTLESSFENVVKTYSTATLNNTQMVIIENEPDAHVFRYIRRADVERIFDARKNKINDMVDDAGKALSKGQINDALRYYYWAHALVKSLRYPNELYLYDDEGQQQMANTWIPKKINELLDNLSIKFYDLEEDYLVHLAMTYNDTPVTSIDYTCFDGFGWSNIYSAKEGRGIIELRTSIEIDKLQVKVEYAFENEAVVDPEVKSVLEAVEGSVYKKAYMTISLKDTPLKELQQTQLLAANKTSASSTESLGVMMVSDDDETAETAEATTEAVAAAPTYSYPALNEVENVEEYRSIVDKVIDAVVQKSPTSTKEYFSEKGYAAYNQLIGYGSARILDASEPKYYQLGEKVFCRNILMSFSFKSNNRTFTESVVFEFDADKKISNVSFGLSNQATEDVFSKESWPREARIILIHFLEGYKTAYGLKQLDYIESIFAEDALIITGSYVRQATTAELSNVNREYVQYTRQSKSEYIRNLKYVFAGNEYININFADNELVKAGKGGEIYGIQIKQEYHSTNYGDSGYLFLMVDLNNIDTPIIHVRTWQPDKDPDFGTYGLANF